MCEGVERIFSNREKGRVSNMATVKVVFPWEEEEKDSIFSDYRRPDFSDYERTLRSSLDRMPKDILDQSFAFTGESQKSEYRFSDRKIFAGILLS